MTTLTSYAVIFCISIIAMMILIITIIIVMTIVVISIVMMITIIIRIIVCFIHHQCGESSNMAMRPIIWSLRLSSLYIYGPFHRQLNVYNVCCAAVGTHCLSSLCCVNIIQYVSSCPLNSSRRHVSDEWRCSNVWSILIQYNVHVLDPETGLVNCQVVGGWGAFRIRRCDSLLWRVLVCDQFKATCHLLFWRKLSSRTW